MRRARVIPRHFALGMQRIDAQTDIERVTTHPRRSQYRGKPGDLARRIENHMVGQMADFGEVFSLVSGAIGRDFTTVMFASQLGLPQPRRANAIEIAADQRRHPPHAERLHRGK